MDSSATATSSAHTGGCHGPNEAGVVSTAAGSVHGGATTHTPAPPIAMPQVTSPIGSLSSPRAR